MKKLTFTVVYLDLSGNRKTTTVKVKPDRNPSADRHNAFQAFFKKGLEFSRVVDIQ